MNTQHPEFEARTRPAISELVPGQPLAIGSGFEALGFKHDRFDGLMDPLVMVDHFVMTEPTFGVHPHAGMSAVSVVFEDSQGRFHNRDSLGNDFDISPGDLYWLKAGRGAVHDEAPLPGARIHALQVFVNLPAKHKADAPASLHVPAEQMPVIHGDTHRVRVVLGESQGVRGAASPALPLTILDIKLARGGSFTQPVAAQKAAWILAVRGKAHVQVGDTGLSLPEGAAIAVRTSADATPISLHSENGAQLALFIGTPVREHFVQQGPFVMSTIDQIEAAKAAHAAGELGAID
ncbi:pirin-like C-terminal cupin domain-containing protein [Hyphobacterium sp. HN65]|uniref:Pirin-like C-terminal cupin domain-containing protein n=1 Tax=Hyphobacterium lacteum TaxID=3116575 RepID=A0ABU7LNZ7_9PROT|nr:pirin-like C-terminal cupin domain-containing protein [Hyphobacterium sp. HN65]MEE2525638.1 pirin-like C-terminal cupin domain-containing protein [Hyphobacterium sp. HN65]